MKLFCCLALLLFAFSAPAQSDSIGIIPFIILPKDSLQRTALLTSLQVFLPAVQAGLETIPNLLESEKGETLVLLDEVAGTARRGKQNLHFYNPYLTNVVRLSDSTYSVQLAYIHSNDAGALMRAYFTFIAHQKESGFVFSSPLLYNTRSWKTQQWGNHIFHYSHHLNQQKVEAFSKLARRYDAKLKLKDMVTDYYCCDNLLTAQKLIGMDYKLDYNGLAEGVLSHTANNRNVVLLGNNNADFNHFDPHDLWHDRLSLVIDRSKVNKPVDEGIAYLYGGSWGLSWKEICKAFKEQVASNPVTDWIALKETPVRFTTGPYNNSADYIVNALLVQKIEREKGFAGVWEWLTVGPSEKGNAKYFQTLEKLTGITTANYNAKVWELVNAAH